VSPRRSTPGDLAELLRGRRSILALAALFTIGGLVVGLLLGFAPLLMAAIGLAMSTLTAVWMERRHRDREEPPGFAATVAHFSVVAVAGFALMQLVPYGRDYSNPPVTGEPDWASERTRELMVDACYGCHSNEVEWPWYSKIAPVSWAVADHVDRGRDAVNYSEFTTDPRDADESLEVLLEGSMPPGYYTRFGLHPEADLSESELAELVEGLRSTPGLTERGDREGRDDD
jgi:hypothetical protein